MTSTIGRYYAAARAHARDPIAHPAPPPPEPDRLWQLYDPIGAELTLAAVPIDAQVARLGEIAERAIDRIAVARVALAAARQQARAPVLAP